VEAAIPRAQRQQIQRLVNNKPETRERFARWLVDVQRENYPAAVELVRTNLSLSFPGLPHDEIERLVGRNLLNYFNSMLTESWLVNASDDEVRQHVSIERIELLHNHVGKPLIVVCPHMIGCEDVYHRLALEAPVVALYSGDIMGAVLKTTPRFKKHIVLPSSPSGIRTAIREVQKGQTLFVMPDLNPMAGVAVKVPLFGRLTATSPLVGELVKYTGASVIAVVPKFDGSKCSGVFHGPLKEASDAPKGSGWSLALNQFFEREIRRQPERYWWGHPRFASTSKTEQSPYSAAVDLYIAMTFCFSRASSLKPAAFSF
jgi:Kdo2-lipid IVA lauroyltransferase/acyltransferase